MSRIVYVRWSLLLQFNYQSKTVFESRMKDVVIEVGHRRGFQDHSALDCFHFVCRLRPFCIQFASHHIEMQSNVGRGCWMAFQQMSKWTAHEQRYLDSRKVCPHSSSMRKWVKLLFLSFQTARSTMIAKRVELFWCHCIEAFFCHPIGRALVWVLFSYFSVPQGPFLLTLTIRTWIVPEHAIRRRRERIPSMDWVELV